MSGLRLAFALLAVLSAAATAQEPVATKLTGSVAGVVVAGRTGTPLRDAEIALDANSRTEVKTTSDEQGHYSFRDVASGAHRVTATQSAGASVLGAWQTRQISLSPGEALSSIDFHLPVRGSVSGRVIDENKEPMPGITVLLVAREYSSGTMRYVYADVSKTNDLGEYKLQRAEPNRAYLLMAQKREFRLPAISDAPSDPRLRRRVPAPVFYPGSSSIDGAGPITLQAGESREGLDIQMRRVKSYCVDGTVEANGRPGSLTFQVTDARPTSGPSGGGGLYLSNPNGKAGEDGRFRVCGLVPGEYTFTSLDSPGSRGGPKVFGNIPLAIGDRDVHDVRMIAPTQFTLPGEVVIEGPPSASAIEGKLSVNLMPLTRSYMGENSNANAAIPGLFAMEGLPADEYSVRIFRLPAGLYLKDIEYNNHSVLYGSLRLGSAIGDAGMRVSLGNDGGYIKTTVADKDGNPLGDSWVLLLPARATSEAMLAAAVVSGQTDQKGSWNSNALEPGKYFLLAASEPVDKSPETIGKLWNMRTHAQEIELSAMGTVSVSLTPVSLR